VLVHGGYWKQKWDVDNTPLPSLRPFLLDKGFAVADVEYRRREDEGGRWPGTNQDIVSALGRLKEVIDQEGIGEVLSDVTFIGHSVGGQMVLWLDSQDLAIKPTTIVSVAPVADMIEGYRQKLSDEGDAVEIFMNGLTPDTEEGLREYKKASPAHLLPFSTPLILAIGSEDMAVPPQMGLDYYQKVVESGGSQLATLVQVEGADHYTLVTASEQAWLQIYSALEVVRAKLRTK